MKLTLKSAPSLGGKVVAKAGREPAAVSPASNLLLLLQTLHGNRDETALCVS